MRSPSSQKRSMPAARSEEDGNVPFSDPDLKNIYLKMLDYLSSGDMAEQRLIDRVVRLRLRYPHAERYRNYTVENARKVLPALRRDGYLDEERYARHVLEKLKDKRDGLRSIQRKMLSRKIERDLVTRLLQEFEQTGEKQNLDKIIAAAQGKKERLIEKFGSHPKKKYQIRAKLYSWLAMRGYSSEESSEILKKL